MKVATTLRTQQAVARYGKAAGHPLCQAALNLWRWDAESQKSTKDLVSMEEVLNSAKQMKENAQALIKQLHKERNAKEAKQVSMLLRKIDKQLLRVQEDYEAVKKLPSKYQELRRWPAALFGREYDAALYAGDLAARRALQRVRKRWSTNEAHLKDGDYRKVETLNMLRDKVKKAAWQLKGGASAGYWEALQSGDRALSDEVWQGRLTAREIHLHLVDAGVSSRSAINERRQLHEIRRIARKLGICLAEDQRGRKPYLPNQPKIVKRICPECLKYEQEPKRRLCRYCAIRPTFVHSWVAT